MVQIYTWAYQDWKTITEDKLKELVGLTDGITAADFKAITGDDYVVASTTTPTTAAGTTTTN